MTNCLLVALLLTSVAHAGSAGGAPIAKTSLSISSDAQVAAVTFELPPHWHIYWQNPGDSGIAPTFDWTLPKGTKAGEILWPTPKRFAMGDIINYGYGDTVTLLVPLETPKNASGEVTVKANWLVCEEICIPEKATLTAVLPGDKAADDIIEKAKATLPVTLNGTASYFADAKQVMLQITTQQIFSDAAQFFPVDDRIVTNSGAQQWDEGDGKTSITLERGDGEPVEHFRGVIRDGDAGFEITATRSNEPLPALTSTPLLSILLLAIAGGLLLNLMPCVLPILSLKALALVKKAGAEASEAHKQGVYYTAGVVGGFLIVAIIALILKSIGMAVGWGFQLQQPEVIAALIMLMVLVTLNLLGKFELPVLFGSVAVQEKGARGSLMTGLLAVALATPCTTPFMAPAIGATLVMPPLQSLLVFASLGLGMALPFLIISHWPAALRLLPKPGAWMARFKKFLALPVLATAIWLLSVQMSLNGVDGMIVTLAGVTAITLLIYYKNLGATLRWALITFAAIATLTLQPDIAAHNDSAAMVDVAHEAYSEARLAELRAAGTPVFVNATADWCITCKFNERAALGTDRVRGYFKEKGIAYLVADWTRGDLAITTYLNRFQRNGVPLYVYYPSGGEPVVLPQLLTPLGVIEALEMGSHTTK